MKGGNKIKGFTLLEVLLAMAIFSILLTALYSTFFLSERAVRGVEDSLLRLHEMRTAMDIMEREIEGALKGKAQNETAFTVKDRDMYGRQTSGIGFLTFCSPAPGPVRVSYYVAEEDGKLNLYKRFSTIASKTPMEAPVLEDIESFGVEAKDEAGQGQEWIRTWNRETLPGELKLTLAVRLNGKVVTLTGAVRPRVGGKV